MGNKKETDGRWKYEFIITAGLMIATAVILVLWTLNVPLGNAPDEVMRYQIVEAINSLKGLPRGDDPSLLHNIWGISYAFLPITSFIFSAWFRAVAMLFTSDADTLLFAARLVNILFGIGSVYIYTRIGKKLESGFNSYIFIFAACFLPQFLFVNIYVNMDAMALFGCALLYYMWIVGHQRKWDKKSVVGLAVAVSVCAISYYNTYVFVLFTVVYFCVSVRICEIDNKDWWKVLLLKGFSIVGIVFLLTGWWFIRNAILYDGDFLGMNASNLCAEKNAAEAYKPSNLPSYYNQGKSYWSLFTSEWFDGSYWSFIGNFGNMNQPIDGRIYLLYKWIFQVGFLGYALDLKDALRFKKDGKWVINGVFNICSLCVIFGTIMLAAYYSYVNDYQFQGRYWLPMMACFMYVVARGLNKWLKILEYFKMPKWANNVLCVMFCIGYFGLFMHSYVTICLA